MDTATYDRGIRMISDTIGRYKVALRYLRKLRKLCKDSPVVSSMSFDATGLGWVYLNPEADPEKTQKFIHKLARQFGTGEKVNVGGSLAVEWRLSDDFTLSVRGYVPPSCTVVTKQRMVAAVPAKEGVPAHFEPYSEIQCEGSVEADLGTEIHIGKESDVHPSNA